MIYDKNNDAYIAEDEDEELWNKVKEQAEKDISNYKKEIKVQEELLKSAKQKLSKYGKKKA